ncbi:MAG TPA: iron chelate uptake ABC transporter family permease subunit [Thermaerobacter sp.]
MEPHREAPARDGSRERDPRWVRPVTLARRRAVVLGGLVAALLVAVLTGIGVGAVHLPPGRVLALLWDALARGGTPGEAAGGEAAARILLDIRLPRVLLAALVGASLASAGASFQALFRNPMADPYVLGVSSGGALGAAVAFYALHSAGAGSLAAQALGFGLVPASAFTGAVAAVTVVRRLAQVNGRLPVTTLLLAGVAVAALLGAVVSLLVYLSGDQLRPLVFWLLGSLSGASWRDVAVVSVSTVLGTGLLAREIRGLNALLTGEEPAYHLGVDVERLKRRLLVAGSLLTATAVSVSGVIGFVGLIVPQAVRLLVGGDHRMVVPAATLAGATVLVLCDTAARTVIAPAELPVGVVTALAGAPFFLYLLRSHAAGGTGL